MYTSVAKVNLQYTVPKKSNSPTVTNRKVTKLPKTIIYNIIVQVVTLNSAKIPEEKRPKGAGLAQW